MRFNRRVMGMLFGVTLTCAVFGFSRSSKADDAYCTDEQSCAFLEGWCEGQNPASYEWTCFTYDTSGQCSYGACRFLGTSPTPAPNQGGQSK